MTGLLTRSWMMERVRINVGVYCGIQWWEGIKEKNRTEERRKEENEDGSITKMESSQSPDDDTNK